VSFEGGLFLEANPTKTLEANLQNLTRYDAYKKIIWLKMLTK
jgi:hypothetical protein